MDQRIQSYPRGGPQEAADILDAIKLWLSDSDKRMGRPHKSALFNPAELMFTVDGVVIPLETIVMQSPDETRFTPIRGWATLQTEVRAGRLFHPYDADNVTILVPRKDGDYDVVATLRREGFLREGLWSNLVDSVLNAYGAEVAQAWERQDVEPILGKDSVTNADEDV